MKLNKILDKNKYKKEGDASSFILSNWQIKRYYDSFDVTLILSSLFVNIQAYLLLYHRIIV